MKNIFILLISISLSGVIIFISCKKETSCEGCRDGNKPPTANAGPDQVITLPIDSVLLDGNRSSDPDGKISEWFWTKISGPASFNIVKPSDSITKVKILAMGTYQFELKVTDNGRLSAKDTVQVMVNAQLLSPLPQLCDNNRPHVNAQLIPFGTLSQDRFWISAASAGDKIVFAGGLITDSYPSSRVDIYDMVTQTWTTAELSVPRYDMATVTAGNKIFFAGGEFSDGDDNWHYSSAVDIYDVSTNTWSFASLSQPRGDIAAATVGNKVFFAGGENDNYGDGYVSDKVDIYDIPANTWSTELLSEPRSLISAATVNNKIYFAGGSHLPPSFASDRIDIYDDITSSWTTSSLMEPKTAFASISVADKIYWAGGYTPSTPTYIPSCAVEIKDVNTENNSIAYLYKPGEWRTDMGEKAVVKDTKIVFLRQWPYNNGQLNPPEKYFDIYDISNGTWSIGELPASPTTTSGSIISANNIIYVTSGWGNNGSTQVWKLEF